MDEFLLHLIPSMLRELANGPAYPGNDEFPTYESWQMWCNSLANRFENVQEEHWDDGRNEWENQWHSMMPTLFPHPNLTTTCTFTTEQVEEVRKNIMRAKKNYLKSVNKLFNNYILNWQSTIQCYGFKEETLCI